MKILEVMADIQSKLSVPKGQMNKFGNYKYRSCEDIVEALKPLLAEHTATLNISDEMVQLGERYYVKATATIACGTEFATANAYAREPLAKKGMDEAQITGATSSYARKYALNGLLAIDDTKDADTNEVTGAAHAKGNVEGRVPDMTMVDKLVTDAKAIIDNAETMLEGHEKVHSLLKGVRNAEKEAFGEKLKQDKHEFITEKGNKTQRSYATTFRELWDYVGIEE